jgi:hypothetical protein
MSTFSGICHSIIGGGLPALPGTASSTVVASAPEVSVSMVVARRGAKKFRVATSLLGVFLLSAAGFFEVGAASLVLWHFRLRTSLKPSSCVGFTD